MPAAALAEKSKVVRCVLEGKQYSSIEIDRIFSASKAQGKSLYYVDEELLQSIRPDVIFTQDVCEVCQIDTACTAAAVAKLDKQPAAGSRLRPITCRMYSIQLSPLHQRHGTGGSSLSLPGCLTKKNRYHYRYLARPQSAAQKSDGDGVGRAHLQLRPLDTLSGSLCRRH